MGDEYKKQKQQYHQWGDEFEWAYTEEPHSTRRAQILERHPEVKECFGVDYSFKYVVVAMSVFQLLMAYLLKDSSWPLICAQAYFVSGTISHALTLAVHELSHNLGFGHGTILPNRFLGFVANLPMCVPMSVSFKKYHMEHHRNLGEDMLDTDVPTEFEARFFTGPLGKFVWLFLQPVFYAVRPLITYKKSVMDLEVLNAVVQIAYDVAVIHFLGWRSFAYLFGGFVVGLGLHPLAAHFVSDHYVFRRGQETYSYYGPINMVTFNVGYHVEHHDFPFVAGKNLHKISQMAPEFYENLEVHTSWLRLLYDFVTDPSLSLHRRVKRPVSAQVQYYGTGAYATSYLHCFVAELFNRFFSALSMINNGKDQKAQ